jgi:alpha-beta hydrolase superfamily lysophospholipase
MTTWQEDVLGDPYEARKLTLAPDFEGATQATLVRRLVSSGVTQAKAVLHIHGFADYFFQTVAADFWVAHGFDFYAIDLRKYGRSLLAHQTPNFTNHLSAYYEELDLAWAEISQDHSQIVVSGHSTGGLVASLWLHDQRHDVDGVFLNSPWLDFQGDPLTRHVKLPLVEQLGQFQPLHEVKRETTGIYARSLHQDYFGEWDFNLHWKPIASFKAYAGWIRTIRSGQRRIANGLEINAPVLMICSGRSGNPTDDQHPDAASTDVVLDVEQMRRRIGCVSHQVTMHMIEGALHDVTLSRAEVRGQVFSEISDWLQRVVAHQSADQ